MTELQTSEIVSRSLEGRTVVLTGGAQGIGAATVQHFRDAGANVIFGDWAAKLGKQVEDNLNDTRTAGQGQVYFQQVDVRDYASQLALFDLAKEKHGRVDVAVSCAAIGEPGGWFEPHDLNMESVRKEPLPLKNTIDINLSSVLSFCRIALAFLADKSSIGTESEHFSKSIVLVSSIAGITEAPGLFAYSSAKHGVVGLLRALRGWAPVRYGVRANAICPWATDTQLFSGVKKRWLEEKLPLNQPDDVARFVLQCAAESSLNGRAVFVSGGRGFDTEEGYDRTLPQWMGEENAKDFLRGQQVLGLGDDWTD